MKKFVLLSLVLIGFTACHSQNASQHNTEKSKSVKIPHGSWTVHKQYDADGNLISKDSVYTYSYSSINGKQVPQAKMDSLFHRFHGDIRSNFGRMNIPEGYDMDSLENSFFNQNMGNLQNIQQQMMQQMRSMQKQFLNQFQSQGRRIPREKSDSVNNERSDNEAYRTRQI